MPSKIYSLGPKNIKNNNSLQIPQRPISNNSNINKVARKCVPLNRKSLSSNNLLSDKPASTVKKSWNTEQLNRLYLQMLHQRRCGMAEAGEAAEPLKTGVEMVMADIVGAMQPETVPLRRRSKSKSPAPQQQPIPELVLEEDINSNENNKQQKCDVLAKAEKFEPSSHHRGPLKRWTSAFRVVSAMNRFRHFAKRHHLLLHEGANRCSSSVSGSNESTPTRFGSATVEQEPDAIDPVYLALKQATTKYGNPAGLANRPAGTRRGSHCVGMTAMTAAPLDSNTPSPGNLSQISLQDSGTYSASELCSSSSRLPAAGSTPHLNASLANNKSAPNDPNSARQRPKLTTKMKSLSLDCAEMPPTMVQLGMRPQYRVRPPPMRSARGTYGESFDHSELLRSTSPPSRGAPTSPSAPRRVGMQPRRLPPVPVQNTAVAPTAPVEILHIVTHEYAGAECQLHPGDRLVVVDNGDPDWKHGFKVIDRMEQLLTFPSSCVAAYKTEEQPMRLVQTCNLVEQKLRLYRDQIVFVQPNSLRPDGHVMVRNEHDKFAHCPLQYLTLV